MAAEAPKVHKCLFWPTQCTGCGFYVFNMKLPTFKNGKIPHKMDLTPLEVVVDVVVLAQGSAVGRG